MEKISSMPHVNPAKVMNGRNVKMNVNRMTMKFKGPGRAALPNTQYPFTVYIKPGKV